MSGWQKAFVLHTRLYTETSLLVDLFTENFGLVTVLAKGARRKRSAQKGILQPFTPLIVQYSGAGNIKTLRQVEAISLALPLYGRAFYSGFYLNELVHRVLVQNSEYQQLFHYYLIALQELATQQDPEHALRRFELALLETLGYSVNFRYCCATGEEVVNEMTYQYRAEKGFIGSLIVDNYSFTGAQLKAFAERQFTDLDTLKAAKRFIRIALKPYVGSQPFKSRELFRKP